MSSEDWTDADVAAFVALCGRVQVHAPDLLACMFNESDARASTRNPRDTSRPAVAVGLIQFTRAWLGKDADLDAFRTKSVGEQLRYVEQYFTAHIGQCTSRGKVYTALFLPACLTWPNLNDTTVLCGMQGPFAWAYRDNLSLDVGHKGWISVGDLAAKANAAAHGARWDELFTRVQTAMTRAPDGDGTTSETFPGNDEGSGTAA